MRWSPRCRWPGRTARISTRMRRTRAEGNAVAKTGSIANVRALSGFVRTRDGEVVVFSILANDFVIPAATVNWIADLAVESAGRLHATGVGLMRQLRRVGGEWPYATVGRSAVAWSLRRRVMNERTRGLGRRDAVAQPEEWLDNLYSQNPREVEAASEEVASLGARALPTIQATSARSQRRSRATQGGVEGVRHHRPGGGARYSRSGRAARGAGSDVRSGHRLSYMGREALPPLREALDGFRSGRPTRSPAVDRQAQGSRAAGARGRAAAAPRQRRCRMSMPEFAPSPQPTSASFTKAPMNRRCRRWRRGCAIPMRKCAALLPRRSAHSAPEPRRRCRRCEKRRPIATRTSPARRGGRSSSCSGERER